MNDFYNSLGGRGRFYPAFKRETFGRDDEDLADKLFAPMAAILCRLAGQGVTEGRMAELLDRHGIDCGHGVETAIVDLIRDYQDIKWRLEKIQGVLNVT